MRIVIESTSRTGADPGAFEMPFGKHKGKTLDQIAETDQGLLYLDWLWDEIDPLTSVGIAIQKYQTLPVIQKELDEAVERRNG